MGLKSSISALKINFSFENLSKLIPHTAESVKLMYAKMTI
ncbi:hypothetical protein STSP2_03426 [Anaerohalosphaera lusitana]|uniref:Uncharacterized protein n=1 Tax=Anaerohalosphaera lusitana TaxID=1936003 RepID=A0A1U9NRH5_9BACT|nr:hypothetical protein STSP2_03426 [Anaerohalosphaera lusitana]